MEQTTVPEPHGGGPTPGFSRVLARLATATRVSLRRAASGPPQFRAKVLAALREAYRSAHFDGFDDFRDPEAFSRLERAIAKLSWHVYAKPTFARGSHVLDYLGRYTHRVGLANSRLLDVRDDAITFRTKGTGTATLSPVTFLRRFVQHVLPQGFHKIRSFGLYASKPRRVEANRLLGGRKRLRRTRRSWQERLHALTGRDVTQCPHCGDRLAQLVVPSARAPPTVRA